MAIEFDCSSCGRRVKASEKLSGQKVRCPQCQQVITVPDAVYEAEEIPAAIQPGQPPANPFAYDQAEQQETGDEPRRPCPMCGEMILTSAVKCRFCGEVFDPTLRKKSAVAQEDQDMTTGDWVVAVLCSGIGCIIGIIWMIQGKPKGPKMFGVSIGMAVLWNILNVILREAVRR